MLPFTFITGPCQIESKNHIDMTINKILEIFSRYPSNRFNLIFKASFDKANRTKLTNPRGVGIQEGLKVLQHVKDTYQIQTLTDLHLPSQASVVASIVDYLQIPAFLCRQTDLLLAAGETGRPINIKKGQFLSVDKFLFAIEKVTSTGNNKIMLCERGTCFGYDNLVVDYKNLIIMKMSGFPVIFDATHSVQFGSGSTTGGNSKYVIPLALSACMLEIDGLFIECHNDPKNAPSDADCMLNLQELNRLVFKVNKILDYIY
jgi:2-dehydro-3-deoxyphosphooctonate aldolase (KDO 8-P synthase)